MNALVLVVENLRKSETLGPMLKNLGHRHISYGASAKSYPFVGEALLMTLEYYLGKEVWTSEVKGAWIKAYGAIVGLMLAGAAANSSEEATHGNFVKNIAPVSAKDKNKNNNIAKQMMSGTTKNINTHDQKFHALILNYSLDMINKLWDNISTKIINSFWDASVSTICFIVVLFCLFISFYLDQDSLPAKLLNELDKISIVLGLVLFIKEGPDRKKASHYSAWNIIDSAYGKKISQARFMALQDLCDDNVNMSGLDCMNVNLIKIKLNYVQLTYAKFTNSDLTRAIITYGNLQNIDMISIKANGIDLNHSNLSFAKLNNARLNNANLSYTKLICADLTNATLSNADLRGANLTGAHLTGAYLLGAKLEGAIVSLDELYKAVLDGATMPDGTIYKGNK